MTEKEQVQRSWHEYSISVVQKEGRDSREEVQGDETSNEQDDEIRSGLKNYLFLYTYSMCSQDTFAVVPLHRLG